MTTPIQAPNLQDDRWGGYVPWFLRHPEFATLGQFHIFFSRVAHRLKQLINKGEAGNYGYADLGDAIESESHQCFRFTSDGTLAVQIESYFAPTRIASETDGLAQSDPLVEAAAQCYSELFSKMVVRDRTNISSPMLKEAQTRASPAAKAAAGIRDQIRSVQWKVHYSGLVLKRLTVLESVLRLVKITPAFPPLRDSLRRYLAEAQIMLDITEADGKIVPMEEPLFQKEVINRLLPRLAKQFPQQEQDLVKAYHDLVRGGDADTIFLLAVKALEEIARGVSRRPKLTLETEKELKAAFPGLHPTIYITITKLAAHRGDKAGHGRQGPPHHEMRYLLLTVCNVACSFSTIPQIPPRHHREVLSANLWKKNPDSTITAEERHRDGNFPRQSR